MSDSIARRAGPGLLTPGSQMPTRRGFGIARGNNGATWGNGSPIDREDVTESGLASFQQQSSQRQQAALSRRAYAKVQWAYRGLHSYASCVDFITGCALTNGDDPGRRVWRMVPVRDQNDESIQNPDESQLEPVFRFLNDCHPTLKFEQLLKPMMTDFVAANALNAEVALSRFLLNPDGEPQPGALYTLPQIEIFPMVDERGELNNATPFVQIRPGQKPTMFRWPQSLWMIDGFMGGASVNPQTPVDSIITPVHTMMEAQKYIDSFFTSGAKMGMVFKAGESWDEEDALVFLQYLNEHFLRSENGHKPYVLYGDVDIRDMPQNALELAQFIEIMKASANAVCSRFPLDPRLISAESQGSALGNKGERQHVWMEALTGPVNRKKVAFGRAFTDRVIHKGFGAFDWALELVPFTNDDDAERMSQMANALKTANESGFLSWEFPDDLRCARKMFEPEFKELNDDEVLEYFAPAPTPVALVPFAGGQVPPAPGLPPKDDPTQMKPGDPPADDEKVEGKRGSPDQPRSENGQFGSGGGSSSGGSKTLKEQGYTDSHVKKLVKEHGAKDAMAKVKEAGAKGELAHTSSSKTMTAPEREANVETAKAEAKDGVGHLKESAKVAKDHAKVVDKIADVDERITGHENDLAMTDEEDDAKEFGKIKERLAKDTAKHGALSAEAEAHKAKLETGLKKAQYKLAKAHKLADESDLGAGDDESDAGDLDHKSSIDSMLAQLSSGQAVDPGELAEMADAVAGVLKSPLDSKHNVKRRMTEAIRAKVKKAAKPLVDAMDSWTVKTTAALSGELRASIAKGIETLKAIFDRSVREGYTDANKSAFQKANVLPKSGVFAGDFRKALKAHYVTAVSMAEAEVKAAAKEAKGKRATGKTAGGVDNWIESFGENEFDDVYATITKTMRKTFISGLKSGWTTDEFVTQISAKAPALSEVAIERVVRTASTDIFNIGRQNVAEESGDVVAYRYMAILEPERTCEICYNADGLEIGIHDPDVDRIRPPAHPNCRCVLSFITAGEEWETDTSQLSDFVNALESEYGGNLR